MICLACGDCCNRMSPITHARCPHVMEPVPTVFVCGAYDARPRECQDHDFPARVCPVGMMTLHIDSAEAMRQRADLAWEHQRTAFIIARAARNFLLTRRKL